MSNSPNPITHQSQNPQKSIHPPTLFFSGFARLPSSAVNIYGFGGLAVEIEVDPYSMTIVDVACTCLPLLSQKMLISLLNGHHVNGVFEAAMTAIRQRYMSTTQRALIAALEDLQYQVARYLTESNKLS